MVFQTKKYWFGHILKYKAQWVVHRYKQEERLDYVEMFVAVVKPISYKYLFAVRVKRGYRIRHINIVMAFLYDLLDEVIYVKQLYLFAMKLDKVYKLIKVLNGLK